MNKILIAFDGKHVSEGALEFATQLSRIKSSLLTGVFLSSLDYSTFMGYPIGFNSEFMMETAEADNIAIINNIALFKKVCEKNDIQYRVHEDMGGDALKELKKESRFADLLIIGSETFYRETDSSFPGEYLENILLHAECPVLLVPEKFTFPSRVILTYDGSESSVYAIKMFTYLFNEFRKYPTVLVYADDKKEADIPYKIYIEELAAKHFSDISLTKLGIDPRKYFDVWLEGKSNAIIVAGAYGRNELSEKLKKSFASKIISELRFPVFIAHK